MKFTVILIYPDYIADQYGEEFYCAQVDTLDIDLDSDSYAALDIRGQSKYALYLAQKEAWDAQKYDNDENRHPEDFALVSMFEGHIEQIVNWMDGEPIDTEDLHDADRDAMDPDDDSDH